MKEIQYMPIGNMKPSYKVKAEHWYSAAKMWRAMVPLAFVLGTVFGILFL